MLTGLAIRAALARLPWRYFGIALAVAAALWGAYSWAWQRGHDSRDGEVAHLTAERDAAVDSVAQLSGALQDQSDKIDAAGAATKAAQEKAAGAVRKAQERDKGTAALMARLAAVQASGGRCVTPDAVRDSWGLIR